jgi:hypothetical protein
MFQYPIRGLFKPLSRYRNLTVICHASALLVFTALKRIPGAKNFSFQRHIIR